MNKKRSILLFGNYPPPFGGVPAHIKYLAPYLAQKQWSVHILSIEGNKRWGLVPPRSIDGCILHRPSVLDRLLSLANPSFFPNAYFSLRDRDTFTWKTSLHLLSLSAYAKRIVVKHDIQLISAYHIYSAGLISFLISKENRIPFVTTIFGEIYSDPELYHSRRRDVEMILSASSRNFSCSRHCAKSVETIKVKAQVEPVYYGVDVEWFRPDRDGASIRDRFGISVSDPVVIFVGRMVREMGLNVLLETIPQVLDKQKNVRFLIVGKSDELEEKANWVGKKFPLNVFITSNLSMEMLPLFIAAADVAVVPSVNDRACLGLAIAEAMASGKPVIVSNVGGGSEVVVNGLTGVLVPSRDSSALANSIMALLNSPKKIRNEMGKAGRQRVIDLFDKNLVNRKMEEVFREVVG
jgi:glycosyltransferase involved in cell wall biosynthesis